MKRAGEQGSYGQVDFILNECNAFECSHETERVDTRTAVETGEPVVIVFIVQGNLEKIARDPSLNVFRSKEIGLK